MRTTSTRAALAATLLGGSISAWALGLGPAQLTAVLGQPLDVTVPLHMEAREQLGLDCINARISFGDEELSSSQVRLRLDNASSAPGEHVLRISTLRAVNEPVVSIVVIAGCGSAVAREFVAFADPPPATGTLPMSTPPVASPPESLAARSSPAVRSPNGEFAPKPLRGERPPPPPAGPKEGAVRERRVSEAAPGPAAAVPPAAPVPRLRLDPLLPDLAALSGSAQEEAVAEPAAKAGMQVSADAARLQGLETTLAQLRSEMEQTRRMLEALETRARETPGADASLPLLYGLAGLVAALSVAVGWLLLERRRERMALAWNEDLIDPPLQAVPPLRDEGSEVSEGSEEPAEAAVPPSRRSGEADEPTFFEVAAGPGSSENKILLQDETVLENLLDLDQQMAFLIALGQDEAAIELLESHLEQKTALSPWPWLELLALYQHRDDQRAFEGVGQLFAARFATAVPAWEVDLREGSSLEDCAAVLERLERLWLSTVDVAGVLGTLLLQVDALGPVPTLPVYQDLLLLYGVVRERLVSETDPLHQEFGPRSALPRSEGLQAASPASQGELDMMLPLLSLPDGGMRPPQLPPASTTNGSAGRTDALLEPLQFCPPEFPPLRPER